MDTGSVFILIFFIGLGLYLLISHIVQKNKINSIAEQMEAEVNQEEFELEEKKSLNLKINKIQKEIIFTKNYIKILNGEYEGRIFQAKRIKSVRHHVLKKVNLALGGVIEAQKTIMICFDTDIAFGMKDIFNFDMVKKHKHAKKYEFKNDIIDAIVKIYPWVSVEEEMIEKRKV